VPDVRASSPGIASLANLGNTCFLNSVLYTLRFTPGFCHSLHHLHQDLAGGDTRPDRDSEQECLLDVIQTLHHLFQKLCSSDCEGGSDPREPVLPSALLHSIGRLCPLFEGNQQQDAHELLVTLLTSLQDVRLPEQGVSGAGMEKGLGSEGNGGAEGKKSSKKKESENGTQNGISKLSLSEETVNFVKDNFVGVGVMRTKCLECEASTYTKETFTNIDIPILGSSPAGEGEEEEEGGPNFFTSQILASETLRDVNKYWCSECRRLNEAQRSVSYEVLPTVLILQLKRFTTVASKTYVSKLTDFIPTPFTLDCFCTECSGAGGSGKHKYRLYSVILHLGASLASGHYIAYVRAGDTSIDYFQCKRPGSADTIKTSKKRGLFKMFSKSTSLPVEARTSVASPVCPSLACCGLKLNSGGTVASSVEGGAGVGPATNGGGRGSPGYATGEFSNGAPQVDDYWLECDDEQISIITRRELSDMLTTRQSTTTPYLLFYSRM